MLDALPAWLVIRGDEWDSPLVALLLDQLEREGPGQASLLDRLLDALVVSAVQHWATTADDSRPGSEPVTTARWRTRSPSCTTTPRRPGPSPPWPVRSVSRGPASRAGFTTAVGESPIAYLSAWRLALAADLLAGTDDTVAAISRSVGYTSPFTFSDAFKRSYGVSPVEHRRRGRAG